MTYGTRLSFTARRSELPAGEYATDVTHNNWDLWPDESAFLVIKMGGREARPILESNWIRVLRDRIKAGKP